MDLALECIFHLMSSCRRPRTQSQLPPTPAPPILKKKVHWGDPTYIPYSLPEARVESENRKNDGNNPEADCLPRRPLKSILKPPTALSQEMIIRDVQHMVNMAEWRLGMNYQFIHDDFGDEVLDRILWVEEYAVRQEVNQEAIRDAFRLPKKQRKRPRRGLGKLRRNPTSNSEMAGISELGWSDC